MRSRALVQRLPFSQALMLLEKLITSAEEAVQQKNGGRSMQCGAEAYLHSGVHKSTQKASKDILLEREPFLPNYGNLLKRQHKDLGTT